ncbi:MAG: hypothetical protein ABIN94_10920 [Ferruginibacter sp.]
MTIYAADRNIISEIISPGEKGFASSTWKQHFELTHLAGSPGKAFVAGTLADEKTSKLTELTEAINNRRADLFKGIYSSFFG